MNTHIQSQLDRVEAALNTLVDSISSYNPSPAAALSLVSADDGLAEGLEQLSKHQSNHALLLSLRAQSASLDTRIKSTLSQLAATRAELLNTTSFVLPPPEPTMKPTRTADYATLLSYAARIAKFTVPPTYRPPLPPSIDDETDNNGTQRQHQEGIMPGINGGVPSPAPAQLATEAAAAPSKPLAELSEAQRAWLDPASTSVPFTPWPRDDYIRRGALAQIQAAQNRGLIDVENVDLTAQPGGMADAGVEGQTVKEEEEELAAREEEDMRRRRESVNIAGVAAVMQRPRRREEPAKEEVFEGFELYNPDEM